MKIQNFVTFLFQVTAIKLSSLIYSGTTIFFAFIHIVSILAPHAF